MPRIREERATSTSTVVSAVSLWQTSTRIALECRSYEHSPTTAIVGSMNPRVFYTIRTNIEPDSQPASESATRLECDVVLAFVHCSDDGLVSPYLCSQVIPDYRVSIALFIALSVPVEADAHSFPSDCNSGIAPTTYDRETVYSTL